MLCTDERLALYQQSLCIDSRFGASVGRTTGGRKRRRFLPRLRAPNARDHSNERSVQAVGASILKLVSECGVYTDKINGQEQLSLTCGVLIQDLHTHCGVSYEKMPLVITDVLVMLFGKVDVESMEAIVKSSDTYALAAERAGTIVVLFCQQKKR